MKLRVIHETVYHYSPAVQNAQHMAHLRPRTGVVQRVLTHSLQVDPAPTPVSYTHLTLPTICSV